MFKALGKLIKLAFVIGLLVIIGGVCTAIFVASDVAPQRQPLPSIAYTPPERPQAGPSGPSRPGASAEPEKPSGEMRKPLVAHKIEDEQVTDAFAKYQVDWIVTVAKKPTDGQLRHLMTHLFDKARRKGPGRQFRHPSVVTIFAYAKPRYHAGSGPAYIARLMYNEHAGDKEPKIDIDAERLAVMFEPDEDRFGLTEKQRMEVYFKLIEAEDRAMNEAGANEADVSKFDGKKAGRLERRYKRRVCKKYKITSEQAMQIALEGLQKGWPMPPTE